ncbi:hypothetical protein ACOJR9_11050 [Alteromonas sp. A081]
MPLFDKADKLDLTQPQTKTAFFAGVLVGGGLAFAAIGVFEMVMSFL